MPKSEKLHSNNTYQKCICAQKNYSLKFVIIGELRQNKRMRMELPLHGTKLFLWQLPSCRFQRKAEACSPKTQV